MGGTGGIDTVLYSAFAAALGKISATRPIRSYASVLVISTRATSPASAISPLGNSISVRYNFPSISGAMPSSRASHTSGLSFDGPSISAMKARLRSEEHTSELQSHLNLLSLLLLEKNNFDS